MLINEEGKKRSERSSISPKKSVVLTETDYKFIRKCACKQKELQQQLNSKQQEGEEEGDESNIDELK
jgi:hypothetical protein